MALNIFQKDDVIGVKGSTCNFLSFNLGSKIYSKNPRCPLETDFGGLLRLVCRFMCAVH